MHTRANPLPSSRRRARIHGVVVGQLSAISEAGTPLVAFDGNSAGELLPARSIERLDDRDVGRDVVLMFEGGRSDRPILMGFLQPDEAEAAAVRAEVDGERLVLSADREIVLRCGEASITLTKAGKIILRGTYLLSRSSGANRIKGASVQIN